MEKVTGRSGWFPKSLRGMLTLVAIVALVLVVARPYSIPAPIRAANHLLERHSGTGSGLPSAKDYRATSAVKTPSGYWAVRFARVEGEGDREVTLVVPQPVVNRTRFLPW
jgi:hypothetical protein